MGWWNARGYAEAHGPRGQVAPVRHQAGSVDRGQSTLQAGERDARLQGHHQQSEHLGRLYFHDSGIQSLSDLPRLPESRQERDAGEADRTGVVGSRRADPAGEAQPSEIHYRLLAALQPENRLRKEEDRRRHARQGRVSAREPASLAQPRQEDRQSRSTLACRDGIDARSRFRALAARAGKARTRLFAGRRRLHGANQRLSRRDVHDRYDGQRRRGDDRRRLESAAELSELLRDLDRDHGHRRGAVSRRHTTRQLAQYAKGRPAVSDVDHARRMGRQRFRRRHGPRDHSLSGGLHPRHAGHGDAGKRAPRDGNLQRRRPFRRPERAGGSAAVQRNNFGYRRSQAEDPRGGEPMKTSAKGVGLAIIGGGRVGLFRGEVAARHPAVEWIGLAEKNPNRAGEVGPKIGADFVTQSHVELLNWPEVTAEIICTDEHLHVDPIMAAVERGIPMLIEKPLATNLAESERVLKAIQAAKLDAVVGYTQRFRRRWLAAKEKCRTGALGDVTMVTSRAFMNRLVAIDNYKRTDDPSTISPMVISGTHALDICMWCLEGKTAVECYARSVDKVLGPAYKGIDGTAGMINFSDGTIYHLNMSWALPVTWPAAVYSLEVGIVGTTGVLTIDDTHRDIVLAVSKPQSEGYNPDSSRLVDFMGSYPPGDMALGELRGPMAEETDSWLNRVSLGLPTAAATVEEAHRNLMLTKALDLSARRKQPVKLPLDPDEVRAAA